MEFEETPRFWYPRVALDAWIDFSSQTVKLRPSVCWENLPLCFSLHFLSLSLSLYPISFLSSPCLLPFLFFFSLSLSNELPPFCLLTPYFLFLSFFYFLISFFSFLFSSIFLIWIASTEWSKSGGNFPPLSSIATCHHHHFYLNFLVFLFPLFPSFDTWLNVSHSHK